MPAADPYFKIRAETPVQSAPLAELQPTRRPDRVPRTRAFRAQMRNAPRKSVLFFFVIFAV